MLIENSILAPLLSPTPTFSPTCTFHTFLPFFLSIFHFIAPAALNHIFQHQIHHQRLFHFFFPLFVSMLSIFQQNTRFKHYQGLYSAKIVFFFSYTDTQQVQIQESSTFWHIRVQQLGFSTQHLLLRKDACSRHQQLASPQAHGLANFSLETRSTSPPLDFSSKTHQRGSSLAKTPAHLSMRSTQTGSSTNPTFKLQTNKSTSIPKTHALHWHCNYDPCSGFCDCSCTHGQLSVSSGASF